MKALVKTKMDTVFETESSNPSSPECSRKFWTRPQDSSPEPGALEEYSDNDDMNTKDIEEVDTSFFYSMPKKTRNNKRNGDGLALATNNANNSDTASKRHQTKILLVSLIESLCQTYGDSPESTRKIFFMICQTLSSLGFIDSEFIDEVAGVRSTYHKAFEQLFYTAAQTVRQQDLRMGNQPKLLTLNEQQEILKEKIESLSSPSSSFDSNQQVEDDLSPLKYSLSIQNSRYRNDFVEVDMLGRGGFASAWRARNKLDDIEYAIKKIRLLSTNEGYDKIFREIKNLARLEHHNVVRYYSSWLEYATKIEQEQGDDDEVSWLSSASASNDDDDESSIFNGQDPTFEESTSGEDSLDNNKSTTVNDEEMSFISFGSDGSNSNSSDSTSTGDLYIHQSSSNSTVRKSSSSNSHQQNNKEEGGFILFIQMQLCPSTLHEYLKFRNQNQQVYFDEQENIELFSQILEGAAYIHQQGLIHRDLKPSNIFLSRPANNDRHHRCNKCDEGCKCAGKNNHEAMVPKIGDFGLAASVLHGVDEDEEDDLYMDGLASTFESQHSSSHSSAIDLFNTAAASMSSSSSFHDYSVQSMLSTSRQQRPRLRRNRTSGVGTCTYAAPEQLAIPSLSYDEKADIYSLGIILFELYNPFSTAMERAETIDSLKKGRFPENFIEKYPSQAEIILSMMNEDPCLRPTALEILEHDLFHHRHNNIEPSSLPNNEERDREMEEMRDRYTQMKNEKEDLQRRLDELQSKLDDCNIQEHGNKKRHHSVEDEDSDCGSVHHESKKLESDTTTGYMISKILFSSHQ